MTPSENTRVMGLHALNDLGPTLDTTTDPAPEKFQPPPVNGSLPYAREDYEKLRWDKKTPEMDFLILGKIPGGKQDPCAATLPNNAEFDSVVRHCLIAGELEALDFLWRQSGRDPGKSTIDLMGMSLDKESVKALLRHCAQHEGLKVDLFLREYDGDSISQISALIALGSVNQLSLAYLSSDHLEQLVPVIDKVGTHLSINYTYISTQCEQLLAESLARSQHLQILGVNHCTFGDSQGKHFIDGVRKNTSIKTLEMRDTPLPAGPGGGYPGLIADNPTLEVLTLSAGALTPRPDTDGIVGAMLKNDSLRELRVLTSGHGFALTHPQNLAELIRTNQTLTTLSLGVELASADAYKAVSDALAKNTSLTELSINDSRPDHLQFAEIVSDLLSRNRALANDPDYLLKAAGAFDPRRVSGLSDAGSLIAEQIFLDSSSREQFETLMTEVELSVRELEKKATEVTPPSVAPTTNSIDATTTTITTAITTTTSGAPPNS